MKILISAFKPFNNESINPSLIISNSIINYNNGCEIEVLPLNVEYNNDSIKLINKIKEYNPDIILCLGQAGGRSKVYLEYFALNMQSASIKDNNDMFISHNVIDKNGKVAYKSTIDLNALVNKINDECLSISYYAGTFICNEIYYNALKYIDDNKLNTKCVFIHIPFIESQVKDKEKVPYLSLDKSKELIVKIIEYLVKI